MNLRYFKIQELVDPATIQNLSEATAWQQLDATLLNSLDPLREAVKAPILINNYDAGLMNRGYRSIFSQIGGKWSQHRAGRAIDFNVLGWTMEQQFEWILANQEFLISLGFTTVEHFEHTPSWVHLDCRNVQVTDKLNVVRPV